MASSGRFPRAILFAAVGAAIIGGTLPAVLKQATPAEDTTDRAALLAQAANDSVTAPAAEPLFMPSPVKVALVNTIPNAPARAGATASPPPASVPQAQTPPATPVAAAPAPPSFPPVQPMDLETAENAPVPVLRTLPSPAARTTAATAVPPATTTVAAIAPAPEAPAASAVAPDAPATTVMAPAPDAPNTTIIATPPAATKHVRRARVGHHRYTRRRYVRPAPFSIRRLFATLRLR